MCRKHLELKKNASYTEAAMSLNGLCFRCYIFSAAERLPTCNLQAWFQIRLGLYSLRPLKHRVVIWICNFLKTVLSSSIRIYVLPFLPY